MNNPAKNPIHEGATIASLVHNYAVRSGLTESQLAELVGTDQTQAGRWRRGVTVPRASNMAALAELLGVDVIELEGVRVESERVRAEVAARKKESPEVDFAKSQAELKAATARIKRLELQLAEALAAPRPT
jgi:transcriptional regulator with XRE-family HTH domain